jgi:hypothetical protein
MSTNNEDNVNYKVKAKKSISIEIKKQAIDDVVTGISYDAIMQKYKLKNKSNISQIMSKKDIYLNAYNNKSESPLRKTLKTTKYSNIDTGLTNFITNCNKSGLMINDKIIKEIYYSLSTTAELIQLISVFQMSKLYDVSITTNRCGSD